MEGGADSMGSIFALAALSMWNEFHVRDDCRLAATYKSEDTASKFPLGRVEPFSPSDVISDVCNL